MIGLLLIAVALLTVASFFLVGLTTEDTFLATVVATTVLLMGGIVAIAFASARESNRLMAQCMADGRKEYECVGILHRNDAQVPIVMPVVVGR